MVQKEPRDMSLGEVIQAMIVANIQYFNRLKELNGKGSPYASEEQIKNNLLKKYYRTFNPLKEELEIREQYYLSHLKK